ncbi:GNAT family N-acetyltransferase [Granulicatella sp. 19428wC4_WM01]|uniref:GNAT family N-acetyltransferase n=1 Tax=unclassified Granulicatella TaxID=2630493 RepID=UPI0010738A32|nr:GNAT family N-acetyltransferase [Granulicatella sp. 19428wC4_WM01]TFU95382.1 GNAT family N-acetyltransferase [Granulicatella sp. WM01]
MEHNKNCVDSTQKEDYLKYSYVVKNEEENVIAGILAYAVIWGILYIDTLWVDSKYRKQGIATTLLNKIIEDGKEDGCHIVHVSTFDFQSPEFYKSMGFECFGILPNAPKGHSEHFFYRNI